MDTVRVAINPQWLGKPEEREEPWTNRHSGKVIKKKFYYYKDAKVNLSYKWQNIEDNWERLFDAVAVQGVAFCPVLSLDEEEWVEGHRTTSTFLSHSVAGVDIDHGMVIDEALADPLYQKCGSGIYTTPSHTEVNPRFRILYRLEQDITNENDMRLLYRALIAYHGSDKACKDGIRLFYGTIDAAFRQYTSRAMSSDIVERLIEDQRESELKRFKAAPIGPSAYPPRTQKHAKQVIDLLAQTYVGNYEVWSRVGWALRDGGFELSDYQYVTAGMMSQKSPDAAEQIWNDWNPYATEKATMGTVYHILRERWVQLPWEKKRGEWKEQYKQKERELRARALSMTQ